MLNATHNRPVIFDFHRIEDYLSAVVLWHKAAKQGFSLRNAAAREQSFSHSQLSRLVNGKRRLTSDIIEPLAKALELSWEERAYLDLWAKTEREKRKLPFYKETGETRHSLEPKRGRRKEQNHILENWLNVYLRDASKLEAFKPDPVYLHRLLGAIASPQQISRSLKFLLREGFLRRTIEGRVVVNETLITSSTDIPNKKLRGFHKQALRIAQRNIDLLPLDRRREYAVILHLNKDSIADLRLLLSEFYERLLQFAEKRPDESEHLCQVLINMTQITTATDGAPNASH